MRKHSFANRARQALIKLGAGGAQVTNDALAEALDLVGERDKKPMYTALRDMCKTGEIDRIAPGVHLYKGKPGEKQDIRGAMWAVLRMRKSVTVEDLQELAGASATYAKEYLRMLTRRGVVERIIRGGGTVIYRLVKDTGPDTPENDEKAARLRRIREAKKQALDQIDAAGQALISATQLLVAARIAVNDMPEDTEDSHEK